MLGFLSRRDSSGKLAAALLNSLMQNKPVACFDAEGRVIAASDALQKVFSKFREGIIGRHHDDIFAEGWADVVSW